MKLYFMKRIALETAKGNLPNTFPLYYREKDNRWIKDICGEEPFVEFKEIPDFSLAPLDSDLKKGEIDFENCKIIYKNLMFITESQASDERLWAGLAHSVFYDYMRRRWEYDKKPPKSAEKSIGEIRTRYFFEGGTRGGFFRNALSKCWWVGRALYDKTKSNPFEKLDIIGSNNFSTKVSDIFYNNTYTSNPKILDGIVKCFEYFNKRGVKLKIREQVRPSLQLLNAIGGGIILDCLSSEEISEIMIENIEKILQGDNVELENINDDYYDEDEEDVANNDTPQDEMYVAIGCMVQAVNVETSERKNYSVNYINGSLPLVMKNIIGMKEGDIFESNGKRMKIESII